MKILRRSGFTKIDLLIVLSTVVVISVYLTWFGHWPRARRSSQISCVSNLKQIGLGFRMWSNDHGERFPWQVPAAEGGTLEFAQSPYAFLHYDLVSNEFNSPKILKCPSDDARFRGITWPLFGTNLSYFAGLDASELRPATVLAGDRNVSTNDQPHFGFLSVTDPQTLNWTSDIHRKAGNIGLADGSVSQTTPDALRKTFKTSLESTSNDTVRLSIP